MTGMGKDRTLLIPHIQALAKCENPQTRGLHTRCDVFDMILLR
jgi:hypothetical protein